MSVGNDDVYHQSSNLNSPEEFIALALIIIIYIIINFMIVLLSYGRVLEYNSTLWKFSMLMLVLYYARHIIMAMLIYSECSKIVSHLYAILGTITIEVFILGLLNILKMGFSTNSKYITVKTIKIFQSISIGLHVVLTGPYYYLALRYPFEPTPFSIRPIQIMLQAYIIISYIYIFWQFM